MASFRLGGEAGGQTTTRDSTTGAGPDCSRYGGGDSGGATAELSQPSRELPGVAVSETPSSLNDISSSQQSGRKLKRKQKKARTIRPGQFIFVEICSIMRYC